LVAIESFTAAKVLKPQNTVIADLLTQAKSGKRAADDLALKEKAEAEAAEKTQNQFDSEIAIGTQAMSAKNWTAAGSAFNKAKKLMPESSVPDQKLSELNGLIEKEKAELKASEEKKAVAAAEEKARLKEEARIAAEKEAAEKLRIAEEKKLAAAALATAEAKRLADEAAEKARIKEEKKAAAEALAAEEARKAEEAKIAAQNAKAAEAEKLTLEAAEAERLEKEAKLAAQKAAQEKADRDAEAKLAAQAATAAEAKKLAEEKAEKKRLAAEAQLAAEKEAKEEAARKEEEKLLAEKEMAEAEALTAKMQAEFDQSVLDYQSAISNNDWASAAAAIAVANNLFPGDKKVGIMQSELQKLKSAEEKSLANQAAQRKKAAEKQKKYENLISKGDEAIGSNDYVGARKSFKEALKIFPNEQYPVTKLAEIKELELAANAAELARQQEKDKQYSALMAKGESAMGLKSWEEAEESFKEAKKLKPKNAGPDERMAEIKRLIQKEKDLEAQAAELEEDYKERMKNGQEALDNKQFADAKRFFMGAFKLKPKEKLPQEKLAETEKLWASYIEEERVAAETKKAEELEANYNSSIASGDKAFENQLWSEAIRGYQSAIALKPNEEYPLQRLAAAKSKMAEAEALAVQKQKEEAARLKKEEAERVRLEEEAAAAAKLADSFETAVRNGDQAMAQENYKSAVSAYKKAAEIKPEDNVVADKWAEAVTKYKAAESERLAKEKERKRLAAIELKKRQEAAKIEREVYLSKIRKNSPEELAKNYNDGLTEEKEEIDDTMITKSIIIEKGEGRYLIKFDYPWGEHFYYLNGKKIREDTYNWNIRKYKF